MTESPEWTLLKGEAFDTRRDAQCFLGLMMVSHYGSGKGIIKSLPKELDFRISEKMGKFHIEYRLIEKHTL
jgi:hypothetical protein